MFLFVFLQRTFLYSFSEKHFIGYSFTINLIDILQSINFIVFSQGNFLQFLTKYKGDYMDVSEPKWVNTDYIQYGVSSLRLRDLHIMRNLFVNINIMASNHPIQFEITTFFHKIPLFTQPEKNLDYCVWFKIFPYQIVLF